MNTNTEELKKHAKEQAEEIIDGWNRQLESAINGACEKAYWQFDARRKGYAEWEGVPQAERDAFKAEAYMIAKRYILEPENDVSQTLANDMLMAQEQRDALLAAAELAVSRMKDTGDSVSINALEKAIKGVKG